MSTLPDTIKPRVAQLVRMFGSPHDGEALGAVRAVERTLRSHGANWHDLADRIEHEPAPRIIYKAQPEPPPKARPCWSNGSRSITIMKLQRALQAGSLSAWEADFVASIVGQANASRMWRPTARQEARLDALIGKLDVAGCWF